MAKRKAKAKIKSVGRSVYAYTAKDGAVTIYIRYNAQGTPQNEWIGLQELDANGRDQTLGGHSKPAINRQLKTGH
jgi:hypothetical protein